MDTKNLPAEPGFYWGRGNKYKWWNLIVRIGGDSPYLRVNWILDLSIVKFYSSSEIWDVDFDVIGPKIDKPEI